MSREELAKLRSEARVLQRRANNKVSRLEVNGVKVRNTQHDPRIDLKRVDKYTVKQLTAYTNKLKNFNSRGTQFYASSGGEAVTGKLWREYKRLEREHNKKVNARLKGVSGIHDPVSNLSLGEREKAMTPSGRARLRRGSQRPYHNIVRPSPKNVVGPSGVKALISNMKKKVKTGYHKDVIRRQKFAAAEMHSSLGDESLRRKLLALSDDQFDVLWNYTNYATEAAEKYASRTATGYSRINIEGDDDELQSLHERVKWASEQKVGQSNKRRLR